MGEFLFYFSGLLIIFSLYRILIKKELPKKRKIKKNKSSNTDMKPSERYLKSSKTSLKLATTAGNQDYVRLNEQSIKEWSK